MSKGALWTVIAVLLAIIVGFGFKFMVVGSTANTGSDRVQVLLDTQQRAQVLTEMRQLLASTQQIVEGLSENDAKKIAEAARQVGMQATTTMDVRLKAKLPLDFKKLGFATHQDFDDLANMAQTGKSMQSIQVKLASTMNQCVACHASYQLPVILPRHE